MTAEHRIVGQVYEAKGDMQKADRLIEEYLPFIRSQTAKFLGRVPFKIDSPDELLMERYE